MILFKLPNGSIDNATRGDVVTNPFDISIYLPPVPPTCWAAIATLLGTTSSLSSLDAIYYQQLEPGYELPALIINPIDEIPRQSNSIAFATNCRVQFTVLTNGIQGDLDAETLGWSAYKALAPLTLDGNGNQVVRPFMSWSDGYEYGSLPGRFRRSIQSGRDYGNENAWMCIFEYTFMFGRSMV